MMLGTTFLSKHSSTKVLALMLVVVSVGVTFFFFPFTISAQTCPTNYFYDSLSKSCRKLCVGADTPQGCGEVTPSSGSGFSGAGTGGSFTSTCQKNYVYDSANKVCCPPNFKYDAPSKTCVNSNPFGGGGGFSGGGAGGTFGNPSNGGGGTASSTGGSVVSTQPTNPPPTLGAGDGVVTPTSKGGECPTSIATPQTFKDVLCILDNMIKSMLPIVVSMALIAFFYGLIKFIRASGDAKAIEEGRKFMIWGIIALFVMISIWGILNLFYGDFFNGSIGVPQLPE